MKPTIIVKETAPITPSVVEIPPLGGIVGTAVGAAVGFPCTPSVGAAVGDVVAEAELVTVMV